MKHHYIYTLCTCRIHNDGYKTGYSEGLQRGHNDGYKSGCEKGEQIGEEVLQYCIRIYGTDTSESIASIT